MIPLIFLISLGLILSGTIAAFIVEVFGDDE
jgi:hypothetical protein